MSTPAPIALTCGDPAGVGPEVSLKAWQALKGEVDLFWIGDPRHLPEGTPFAEIADPAEARAVGATALPVLRHDFAAPATPGRYRAWSTTAPRAGRRCSSSRVRSSSRPTS